MDAESLAKVGYMTFKAIAIGFAVGYGIAMVQGFIKDRKNVLNRDVVLVSCVLLVLITSLAAKPSSSIGAYVWLLTVAFLGIFHVMMWSIPATRKWGRRRWVKDDDSKDDKNDKS